MKITIEATPNEVKEVLQAIGSSKEPIKYSGSLTIGGKSV